MVRSATANTVAMAHDNEPRDDIVAGIGFDVGTGFCKGYIYQGERVFERLKFPGEGYQLESAVLLEPDGTRRVGRAARSAAHRNPSGLILHPKRLLASQPHQRYGVGLTPVEATAVLVDHLLRAFEKSYPHLADDLNQCALSFTHPAGWKLEQQKSFKQAIDRARPGLRYEFFPEPDAGAYWILKHVEDVLNDGEIVGVCDFGCGTYDITLTRFEDKVFQQLVINRGDSELGGLNFTGALYLHACEKFHVPELAACYDSQKGFHLSDNKLDFRQMLHAVKLWQSCDGELKQQLSIRDSEELFWESPDGYKDLTVTQDDFLHLCEDHPEGSLWDRLESATAQAPDGTRYTWADVDHVVCIGGSAHLPSLRKRIADITDRPESKVFMSSNPEEVVSSGAAFKAFKGEKTSQVLAGGLTCKLRQGDNHVYKVFFRPEHVIDALGERIERTGQFVNGTGRPVTVQLELAEVHSSVPVGPNSELLTPDEVVPIHTIRRTVKLPVGRHEVRITFTYYDRILRYGLDFLGISDVDVVTGSVFEAAEHTAPVTTGTDILLLLDCSESMKKSATTKEDKLGKAKEACMTFLKKLRDRDAAVGLISFGRKTRVVSPLTTNFTELVNQLTPLQAEGSTPMDTAITLATEQLPQTDDRAKLVIVVTDGHPNRQSATKEAATQCQDAGSLVVAIGIGKDVQQTFLKKDVATTPEDYYHADQVGELVGILSDIAEFYID